MLTVPPPPPPSIKNCEAIPKICQYDGNDTISSIFSEPDCSCCDTLSDSDQDQDYDTGATIPVLITSQYSPPAEQSIPPPPWYEEYLPRSSNIKPIRKTIRRDNRLLLSEDLPILSVSNLRSIWPKLNSFKNDLKMRDISCAMLSEVWQKESCKKQQYQIEKMMNMEGLKYISTPRINKRGGGAAIVASMEKFSLEKIEVSNPHRVEVVFGLLRPKKQNCSIKEIIIAAFYSPPNSKIAGPYPW